MNGNDHNLTATLKMALLGGGGGGEGAYANINMVA